MTTGARCQHCGAAVDDGALFCSKCGVDVSGVQPVDDATVEMPAAGPPASSMRATMRQMLREATLGEYEILNELGRGGMATVFLAHDISLDRKVAIKVMAPHLLEGEGMAERFKLEARTAAQLSHPHIIPIYAVRETDTTLYFIMKFIEGRGLDEIIKRTAPLPIPMVKEILTKVGAALGYAHRRDVVHRDVKPGNVMIDEEGTPIVTDFGIAKVAETQGLTISGTTIGTPSYMSPEQCEARQVSGASDQYSLGVVAFEMLTGKVPFVGDTAVSTMYKHCHEPLPPLLDFRPDCPPDLLETVTRMLAKDPADRWPSLEAAIRKLGTGTDPHLDPIRSQLLELAKEAGPEELLAHLSSSRTPMPAADASGASGSGPHAATVLTGSRAGGRRRVVSVAMAVLLIAAGAVAVLQLGPGADRSALTEGDGVGGAAGNEADGIVPVGGGAEQEEGDDGAEGADPGERAGGPEAGRTAGDADAGGVAAADSAAGAAIPEDEASVEPDDSGDVAPDDARPPAIAQILIQGLPSAMSVGDEVRLSAVALGPNDERLDGAGVRWSVSDASVAGVATDGTLSALSPGEAVVIASVGGVSRREAVRVDVAPVASISVTPPDVTLTVGDRAAVAAELLDRAGGRLEDRPVRWFSGDATVATVGADGTLVAAGPGSTTVTVSADGATASLRVTVEAAPIDTRTAIEEVLAVYERALESRDIEQVRRVNPGLAGAQERQTAQAMAFMLDLDVELTVESLSEQGDRATAEVNAIYRFVNADTNRRQESPTRFTATFERIATGWRMLSAR